jgi:hypothetical protein
MIKVATYNQFSGGAFLNINSLPPERTSKPLDLWKMTFLGFKIFPGNNESLALEYYGMRFTFRDTESGKKYAYYKVTSIVKADPILPDNPDWAARSGPGDKAVLFTDDIPEIIKAHQRQLYRNREEEEYKP